MRAYQVFRAALAAFEVCAVIGGEDYNKPQNDQEDEMPLGGHGGFDKEEGMFMDNAAFEPDSPHKTLSQFDFVDDSDANRSLSGKKNNSLPLILWWTPNLFPHALMSDEANPAVIQCGQNKCLSSTDRSLLLDSRTRGIMFYGTDLDPFDLPLPRKSRHEWALLHEESPLNNFMLSHYTFIKMFNHTSTFRRESDYPLSSQYLYSLEYLIERPPVPLAIKNQYRNAPHSYAPVLYVQSHCGVASDRDRYVQELMKYIAVDSYGRCLHNRDLPESMRNPAESFEKNEFLDFIAKYKFHIAFENAICNDYMTEKLFRCLHLGSVPIYMGSPRAKDWMPDSQSIIMVQDFKSPKELAEYLDVLDKNDDEYSKYLKFKEPGGVTNQFLLDHLEQREWEMNSQDSMDFILGFECYVCRKLSERLQLKEAHLHNKSIPLLPPKFANNSHLGCPQPHTSIGDPQDAPEGDRYKQGREIVILVAITPW